MYAKSETSPPFWPGRARAPGVCVWTARVRTNVPILYTRNNTHRSTQLTQKIRRVHYRIQLRSGCVCLHLCGFCCLFMLVILSPLLLCFHAYSPPATGRRECGDLKRLHSSSQGSGGWTHESIPGKTVCTAKQLLLFFGIKPRK